MQPARVHPNTNDIIVTADSGSLTYPDIFSTWFPAGEFEIIVAAFGTAATTTYDDAVTLAGANTLDTVLSDENLVQSLIELYGTSVGFVCYSYAVSAFDF